MTARDRAFEDWVRIGQAAKVVEELSRRGHLPRLKRSGGELVGPCPLCGGTDRFGVHPGRNVWNCRRCGVGGDAIALAQHIDGSDFLRAVEVVTGEPPPGRVEGESPADRAARETRQRALATKAAADEAHRAAEAAEFRERERRRSREIWDKGQPIAGTPVESYLQLRGLAAPAAAWLRFLPDYPLWDAPPPDGAIVHRGPCMVAAIEGPEGRFAGVHQTWLDLDAPKGKAVIRDRKGEPVPAKKVRGSKKGGSIRLDRPASGDAAVLFIGEGIETVLSIRAALVAADSPVLPLAEFRSSVDLGNLAGKAAAAVAHPTLTRTDTRGRTRRLSVAGPEPKRDDTDPVIAIGPGVTDIVLLGDGDSEPFATRMALERAAARFSAAYPYVTVKLAMAPDGADFNDLWRAGAGAPAVPGLVPSKADGALSCPV